MRIASSMIAVWVVFGGAGCWAQNPSAGQVALRGGQLTVEQLKGAVFECHVDGRPPLVQKAIPHVSAAAGRLEVKALAEDKRAWGMVTDDGSKADPRAAECHRDLERLQRRPLRIVAEAVPLGSLAAALSNALGADLVVSSPLVDLRVSLSSRRLLFSELLSLLSSGYNVNARFLDDKREFREDETSVCRRTHLLFLESAEEAFEREVREMPVPETKPAVTKTYVLDDGQVAAQLGDAYCRHIGTEGDWAVVLGRNLYIHGHGPEQLDPLVKAARAGRQSD